MERQTLVADRIARLLQREGAEFVVGFPENRLLNSASALGMRPIITRTERVAVNIADGFARASDGERIAPCVTQYGPGAEAAFAAVAQAYGDRSPILLIPGEHDRADQDSAPNLRTEQAYRADHPLRRDGERRRPRARRVPAGAARAARRPRRPGPGRGRKRRPERAGRRRRLGHRRSTPRRSQAAPADVAETVRMLTEASDPVILAGQGVLYAGATATSSCAWPSAPACRSRRR